MTVERISEPFKEHDVEGAMRLFPFDATEAQARNFWSKVGLKGSLLTLASRLPVSADERANLATALAKHTSLPSSLFMAIDEGSFPVDAVVISKLQNAIWRPFWKISVLCALALLMSIAWIVTPVSLLGGYSDELQFFVAAFGLFTLAVSCLFLRDYWIAKQTLRDHLCALQLRCLMATLESLEAVTQMAENANTEVTA